VYSRVSRLGFRSSREYWEKRYAAGGTSGAGSYGEFAEWKGQVLTALVTELGISSAVELGCGDGNQLRYIDYPRYLGLDVSPSAVRRCAELWGHDTTKSFAAYEPTAFADGAGWFAADASVSLEVLFHLVEEEILHAYLQLLFQLARRFVIICSSDRADVAGAGAHERHRPFTPWVAQHQREWRLRATHVPPAHLHSSSPIFVYERVERD
jgi:hypothetical protein